MIKKIILLIIVTLMISNFAFGYGFEYGQGLNVNNNKFNYAGFLQGLIKYPTTPPTNVLPNLLYILKENTKTPSGPIIPPTIPSLGNFSQNPVQDFLDNKDAIKAVQTFLGAKQIDGIIGKETSRKIAEFQKENNLKVTGKANANTLEKLDQEMDKSGVNNENDKFLGSKKGDTVNMMRGTNFCTKKDGTGDGDGPDSCGTYTAKCKDEKDCMYIMGSCGTPLYYYKKGNKLDPFQNKNKGIRAVALTKNKLVEIFGDSNKKSYCNKMVSVCYKNVCKEYPILDTGHANKNTIDMTGAVFKDLGIENDQEPVHGLIVTRIRNTVQTAEVK